MTCKLLLTCDGGKPANRYHRSTMTESRPTDTTTTDRRPLPLEAALDRVGDRWSLLLVEAMLDGPRRFGELGDALPGSPRTS